MTCSCILDSIHWVAIERTREWLCGLQSDTALWLPWNRSDDASLFLDGLQSLWFKESFHVELKRWRFALILGCTVVTVMHRSCCWYQLVESLLKPVANDWVICSRIQLSDCVDCRGIEARTLCSCFQIPQSRWYRSRGDSRTVFTDIAVVPLSLRFFCCSPRLKRL